MSRKSIYAIEDQIKAAKDYLNGTRSVGQICFDLGGASTRTVRDWINTYSKYGENAFFTRTRNQSYTKEFKYKVVEEYLDGKGSSVELALKYDIRSSKTLRRWIMEYNSYKELKDYDPKQEVYMAEARRKTTKEERIEIVEYCIDHKHDYKGTAEKYDVSYSQVYSWVRKYDSQGEDGLNDKRGRHKSDDEVDELEKLRRENKRLKRQLEEKEMTVKLLKKVKEFERRRFSPEEN